MIEVLDLKNRPIYENYRLRRFWVNLGRIWDHFELAFSHFGSLCIALIDFARFWVWVGFGQHCVDLVKVSLDCFGVGLGRSGSICVGVAQFK